eukprot:scaffold549_cov117-Isochrysis_galbana.AAC.12
MPSPSSRRPVPRRRPQTGAARPCGPRRLQRYGTEAASPVCASLRTLARAERLISADPPHRSRKPSLR